MLNSVQNMSKSQVDDEASRKTYGDNLTSAIFNSAPATAS